MYKFKEEHRSIADPSFSKRLKNALQSSEILSKKIDVKPMLKKKYKKYNDNLTVKNVVVLKVNK